MELVSILKENATSSLLVVYVIQSKAPNRAPIMHVEEIFSSDPKEKASASTFASTTSLVHPLFHYA